MRGLLLEAQGEVFSDSFNYYLLLSNCSQSVEIRYNVFVFMDRFLAKHRYNVVHRDCPVLAALGIKLHELKPIYLLQVPPSTSFPSPVFTGTLDVNRPKSRKGAWTCTEELEPLELRHLF